jgi:microcystin-dependent protein
MASTFSANLNLELQGTGDNVGTWGGVLNSAALDVIDNAMGDTQTFSTTTGTTSVTTTQSQVANYVLTSTLVGNVTINWPAIGRIYTFTNNTTGNFSVTLQRNSTGTTVTAPQGRTILIILSSTGVTQLTDAGSPVGQVAAYAMSTVPSGWLECDGTAVSRTTYAVLFGLISTTYGVGNGTTTFNLPDLRGYFVRGWNHGAGSNPDSGRAIASTQTSANLAHTHTGTTTTNGAHTHTVSTDIDFTGGNAVVKGGANVSTVTTSSSGSHNHTFTTDSSGGTESRPYNVAMLYAIRVL